MPQSATVSVATHDLATLRGYWTADDIAAKVRLGILTGDLERQARDERSRDKNLLLQALAKEGFCPSAHDAPWTPQLADAIHAYLARSPALLFMVQLDDLTNEIHQANLPGTIMDYPNWRRRLGQSLEEIASNPALAHSMAIIARERSS
jgi:4-alpha-glucanotransferase